VLDATEAPGLDDGAHTVAELFEQLTAFIEQMAAEEERASPEALSQEQLTVYDFLLGVDATSAAKDRQAVKKLATELAKKIARSSSSTGAKAR
jgi:type I restriction enzyme R subunit